MGQASNSLMLGGFESPFCTGGGGYEASMVRRTDRQTDGCHRTTSNGTGSGTGSRAEMLGKGKCAAGTKRKMIFTRPQISGFIFL